MKIYTKTGDAGETGLFGGPRVSKAAPRIEACGTLDELNALLGVVRATGISTRFDAPLGRVQHQLFDLGAAIAAPQPSTGTSSGVATDDVETLEREIDAWEATLPALRQFILPGGSPAAAQLHAARTVCRRVERRLVTLAGQPDGHVDACALRYVNRLSDWLFVLARAANQAAGVADVPWEARARTVP